MADPDIFLRDTILAEDIGEVLACCYGLPSAIQGYRGAVTYIGITAAQSVVASSDYTARIRTTSASMTLALERMARTGRPAFALVYLDGDHSISSLVRQINAAVDLSTAETVFVLPGAVPRDRAIAHAAPVAGHDWWVGEVWTLVTILKNSGAVVKTHPTDPFGLLFASNVQRLDPEQAATEAAALQNRFTNDFDEYYDHDSLQDIAAWVFGLKEKRRRRDVVSIIIDQNEYLRKSSTVVNEKKLWRRRDPVFAHDLSGAAHNLSKLFDCDRVLHAVQVDEFEDCFIAGRDVILRCGDDLGELHWFGKNTDLRSATGWLQHVAQEPASDGDIITAVEEFEGGHGISRLLLETPSELPSPIFLGTPDEHPNYGMWLLYSIPGVRLFREWRKYYPKYMAPKSNSWQQKMLLALGLDEADLLEHRLDTIYHASAAATMRQTYRDLALSASDTEAFDEFAERALLQGHAGPERIFISRLAKTRAGGHRGLRNEEALIAALELLGFTAVEPELHTLAEQAGLFRSAKVVVGLGGAGMFNVAFCNPGTKVVDIESGLGFVDAHCNLFASRETEYGIIIGSIDIDHPSPYQKTWSIDVDEVVRTIRAFL